MGPVNTSSWGRASSSVATRVCEEKKEKLAEAGALHLSIPNGAERKSWVSTWSNSPIFSAPQVWGHSRASSFLTSTDSYHNLVIGSPRTQVLLPRAVTSNLVEKCVSSPSACTG